MTSSHSIEIVDNAAALAKRAAEIFIEAAREAIQARGRFEVALSGGSTPRATYELLATPQYAEQVDWENVHAWWGDERCVGPEDAASNYRMAREALLSKVAIPEGNVHRMRGELEPEEAAQAYEAELAAHFGNEVRFDLALLGLGEDGHTASLFPGSAALEERERRVAANWVEKLESWRITLTYPVLNAARKALFLVQGAKKAGILRAVLEDEEGK
jgi:6-phosphogluconolactonase